MSTPINFATDVYLADHVALTSGKLVPTLDDGFGNGLSGSVILAVPVLGAGGSGALHITGTFNATSLGLYSALSPDATGWTTSMVLPFHDRTSFVNGPATTQTADYGFGTGLEQYDDAIAAGECYIIVNPGNYWTEITAISFDYAAPALNYAAPRSARVPPLRQYPRNDGLGASSAPRLYPPPRSYQASNRQAGGYL